MNANKQQIFARSSAAVRAAVFDGLSHVLDNHLAHPILSQLLPELRPLTNDVSERVRRSFMDLLYRIKSVRGIRYFDIVPLEELLLALSANPFNKVGRKISAILLNSFFPYNKTQADQMQRATDFVKVWESEIPCIRSLASLIRLPTS